jgi:LysR family cyn operon transcriptional activator
MELRQFKYFLKAAETLNFTEAASLVFISQSTLSQQIKQLEDELGSPLFDRIGKKVVLTEAGSLFYAYAQQSVAKANDGRTMIKDLNNLNTGEIQIGVTYGLKYILTPALIKFARAYPQIKVTVFFATSEELVYKLNHLELDFVLTFEDVNLNENLTLQPLFESQMCLITAKESSMANRKSIRLNEIEELLLVLPSNGYSTRKFINNIFKKAGLSPSVAMEINDIPTLLALVKTGLWHTILAQTTVSESDGLCSIPIKDNELYRKAMIISLKDVYEKKAVLAFYKVLLDK